MAKISEIRTSSIPSGRNHSNPEVKPSVSQKSAAAISNDIKSSRAESSKTDHSKFSGRSILMLIIVSAALASVASALANMISDSNDSENSANIGLITFGAATALGAVGMVCHKLKNQ